MRPFGSLVDVVLPAAFAGALLCIAADVGGQEEKPPPNAYIGNAKCKNCHNAKNKGGQLDKWDTTKHAKAFEVLASDNAKEYAKAKGLADPQQAPECVKCHTTAFGEPAERIAKGFDHKLGVQCESCHGPGENHFKARMKAAVKIKPADAAKLQSIPENEIIRQPTPATCLKCHNEESPGFKPFCFKKRFAEIQHLDPRKKRTDEELAAMKCACGDECQCTKGQCGGLHDTKKDGPAGDQKGESK